MTIKSPDRTRLAVAHNHWTLMLCDVRNDTEKVLFEKRDSSIRLPTFSSDGSRIAFVVGRCIICVWDTSTTALLESPQHSGDVISFVFSSDGTQIISICSNDYRDLEKRETTVEKWDVTKDSSIITFGNCGNDVRFLSLLDAGRLITLSSSGTIQTWDIGQTAHLRSALSTSSRHDTMVISADGARLLSCSSTWSGERVRLFDVVNEKEHPFPSFLGWHAIFSPDSSCVACLSWGIFIVDCKRASIIHQTYQLHGHNVSKPLCFSPDSTRLFRMSTNGNICLIRIEPSTRHLHSEPNYPPEHMMIQHSLDIDMSGKMDSWPYLEGIEEPLSEGWYAGADGTRLLWLPGNTRGIWLASSMELGYMVFGQTASEVATLDLTDYLKVPSVAAAWRNAGIKYTSDLAEVAGAYALIGKY
jgi:WD40 repeat protein